MIEYMVHKHSYIQELLSKYSPTFFKSSCDGPSSKSIPSASNRFTKFSIAPFTNLSCSVSSILNISFPP